MSHGRPSAEEYAMRRGIESGRLVPGQKLPPPPDLTPEETAEWWKIVDPLPPGWITAEHDGLMRDLCRHTVIARKLGEVVNRMLTDLAGTPPEDQRWSVVSGIMDQHRGASRLVIALSRSLRITKQSQYRPQVAAAKAKKGTATTTRPWEDWGERPTKGN